MFLIKLSVGIFLGLLIPMAANGQETHTFPPLPTGARVISEKDGERIAVVNGVVLAEISKERAAKQKPPTVEEAKEILLKARPALRNRKDPPSSSAVSRPQPKPGPPGKIPGANYRNKDPKSPSGPNSLNPNQANFSLDTKPIKESKQLLISGPLLAGTKVAAAFTGAEPHSQPYQFPFTRNEVNDYDQEYIPYATVGTLHFSDPRDGLNYRCTASAVVSTNRSLIFTASHCIGDEGVLFENHTFIPANQLGFAPYGIWTVCGRYPTSDWLYYGDYRSDYGALLACPQTSDGARLHEVIGASLGFSWSGSRNLQYTQIAYPGPPFVDGRQYFCLGAHGKDDPDFPTNPPFGMGCDLPGGSSGAPFLLDFKPEPTGSGIGNYVNGICAYEAPNQSRACYSPYFGDNVKQLYDLVEARDPVY